MSNMQDLMKFPCLHTFKIVGKNSDNFKISIKELFFDVDIPEPKASRDENFISYTVTVMVKSYGELESIYKAITNIEDLKFYL
ncbi:MAG: DUF493 domain-containing protein [Deferribacterales bacterium]|uniref:HP0495 family protein n=1 Tax=Deferrivibrio essentukiensis TaxID=2880922 RepID=UPI0019B826C2|nr:DUF493 domain-containing protein [Deferrivibrio essentukiensis]MBC7195875.1 DUF493 domain-containing protein [Deferribacterales bacterium]MCB4205230.1 DUF493 domain-containing protein [Deferrivibrio essentukiensis]